MLNQYSWEERKDHIGRSYYVDHNTRTTTWTRPSPSVESNQNTASTTFAAERARANNRTLPTETSAPSTARRTSGTTEVPLPAGWGNDYSRACYHDLILDRISSHA